MNSRILRLAYRLTRIAALADRVEFLKKKYPQVDPDKIDLMANKGYDPTGGKYLEWLVRVYASNDYPWGFFANSNKILKMYSEIAKSPTLAELYGVSRDINRMTPTALYNIWDHETSEGLESGADYSTEALRAKKVKEKGSRVIYDQDGYKIIQFGGPELDPDMSMEALCLFGAGTKWCTRYPESAKDYLGYGPIYMVFKGPYKVAQMGENQIQDTENKSINLRKNSELTQLLVKSGVISPKRAYDLLSRGWGDKGPWPELEPALARDPETAFKYADYYLHGRFPLGEKMIAQHANAAYLYAMTILKDRFLEGEEAILKDPKFGPKYQKDIDTGWFDFLREHERKRSEQPQNA
jgi:hypothetical protein